jgi:hypothetical protein
VAEHTSGQDAATASCWYTASGPASSTEGPLAAGRRRGEVGAGGERPGALVAGRKAVRRLKYA